MSDESYDEAKFGEGMLQKMKRMQDMIYEATKRVSDKEREEHEAKHGLPYPLLAASPEVLATLNRCEGCNADAEKGSRLCVACQGEPPVVGWSAEEDTKATCQESWTNECEGAACSQCGFCPVHAYEANQQDEGKCIHCEEKKPKDTFKPDWVSPPGDTLRDWMKEQKISARFVQRKLRLVEWDLDYLLNGKLAVTYELAYRLSNLTEVSMDFWLNREDDYRKRPRRSEMV